MKTWISIISPILWLLTAPAIAQIGIGVTNPTESLSVSDGLNIDHNNLNPGNSLVNGLKFGNTTSPSQMVGISSNRSGGSNSYGLEFYTGNQSRLFISSIGQVGIGMIPGIYHLEVNGTIRSTNNLRTVNSVYAGFDVNAGSSITAGTNITSGNNITAEENITATNGNISATNGALLAGNRGVVMSNNSSRQKVVAYTASLSVGNLASGSSVTGTINIASGTFTSAPTAYVGNVITENGEYYKALLVLENVTTSNITVRVVNPTPNPISFSGAQWKILAIGPY